MTSNVWLSCQRRGSSANFPGKVRCTRRLAMGPPRGRRTPAALVCRQVYASLLRLSKTARTTTSQYKRDTLSDRRAGGRRRQDPDHVTLILSSVLDRVPLVALLTRPLDEHLCDFGAGVLRRGQFDAGEHLSNPGPGEGDVLRGPVRTGLRRRHAATPPAVEGMLEEDGDDPHFARREGRKDTMGVVTPAPVPDPGR